VPTEIAYSIRRSARARRVRVTVDPEGTVTVVLPERASERRAAAAVRELRPWIERQLARTEKAREAVASPPGLVPYLGGFLRLVPEPGRTRAHRRGDELLVPAGDWRPAVERWYRRTAKAEIEPRACAFAAEAGLAFERLAVRDQRTRWGSCSATGTLSFSWRLLLAPEHVLDYVIWHEVCHLAVMDHSPRFWARVAEHCPGYAEPRRWLRRHGGALALGLEAAELPGAGDALFDAA
jgi:predicted metal-dependent hydrolase